MGARKPLASARAASGSPLSTRVTRPPPLPWLPASCFSSADYVYDNLKLRLDLLLLQLYVQERTTHYVPYFTVALRLPT